MDKEIAVIGAGPAGLAAAAMLAHKGYKLDLYESYSTYGGKLGISKIGGSTFDTGPSLLTEPHVIDSVYESCNVNPKKYWSYRKLTAGTNYFWQDGFNYQMPGRAKDIVESLTNTFKEDYSKAKAYFDKLEHTYRNTSPYYLDTEFKLLSSQNITQAKEFASTLPLLITNAHNYNQRFFKNKKVIQLFDRFATYSGSSPYRGPALLSIAGAPELVDGVYYPTGGMRSIADGLYQLGQNKGVKFIFNTQIDRITSAKSGWNVNVSNNNKTYSHVIYAGDYANLLKIVGKKDSFKSYANQGRSTSGIVFYWEVRGSTKHLGLHNIIFSNDYFKEFNALQNNRLAEDSTLYINITSKIEPKLAKKQHENWFVMLNVPAGFQPKNIAKLESDTVRKIESILGIKIKITAKDYLSPAKIQQTSGSYMGAIYGHDSNSLKTAILKPPYILKGKPGIYAIGGTVHPGGGVPLSIRSAKIVARQL